MDSQALSQEVHRRLSPGTPADLGSGWFEGLSMKNHYALIARQSLWQSLSDYLDSLDDEEFKRALVFLRRAFADFSSRERDEIAENLGEIWKINTQQVSEAINSPLTGEAKEMLEGLDDFAFGKSGTDLPLASDFRPGYPGTVFCHGRFRTDGPAGFNGSGFGRYL